MQNIPFNLVFSFLLVLTLVDINTFRKLLPDLMFHWRGRDLTHSASLYQACCFIGEVQNVITSK